MGNFCCRKLNNHIYTFENPPNYNDIYNFDVIEKNKKMKKSNNKKLENDSNKNIYVIKQLLEIGREYSVQKRYNKACGIAEKGLNILKIEKYKDYSKDMIHIRTVKLWGYFEACAIEYIFKNKLNVIKQLLFIGQNYSKENLNNKACGIAIRGLEILNLKNYKNYENEPEFLRQIKLWGYFEASAIEFILKC